MKKAATKLMAS